MPLLVLPRHAPALAVLSLQVAYDPEVENACALAGTGNLLIRRALNVGWGLWLDDAVDASGGRRSFVLGSNEWSYWLWKVCDEVRSWSCRSSSFGWLG
jgi:hypothetical protein